MSELVKFLQDNPTIYIATVGLDGKPRNRPFMAPIARNGKLWFGTSSDKEVYAQLQNNPYVEVTTCSPQGQWIRIKAKAAFSEDKNIKQAFLDISELVKSIYKTADNPVFRVFSLDDMEATYEDFSGNPKRTLTL